MIRHTDLGATSFARLRTLASLISSRVITLGGNRPGKIYGRLDCRAGKRMNPKNRVFFQNEAEAIKQGFRPCAICLPDAYRARRESH
ncbi:Ada metal-binding domain-containing protein [Spirosoma knui]